MLFGILAAFLVAGTPVQDDRLASVRTTLTKQLDDIDGLLADLDEQLTTDTFVETDMPQLGMVTYSEESTGSEDGFHAVRVAAVYTDGPADMAGIRPGDRILAIGKRRLEHETTRVVYLLLAQAPSPLILVVQHGKELPVTLTVPRQQMECVGRGARAIDKTSIRKRADEIRDISRRSRAMVEQFGTDVMVLGKVGELNKKLIGALVQLGANILNELHESIAVSCRMKFD